MTIDAQLMLNMMRQQLLWLEREIHFLQEKIAQAEPLPNPPRPFESLCGIWAGVVFDEEDFEASRLKLPEAL